MSVVDIDIEIVGFGQTNGKTYHARFNCGNPETNVAETRECVTKLAETLLLLPAIICINGGGHGDHP